MSAQELHDAINGATEAPVDWRAEVARLSKLPPIEYDRERQAAAAALGCLASTLDHEVRVARGAGSGPMGQGAPLDLPEIEPWPERVDGSRLLTEIAAAVRAHVILPAETAHALAIWAVFTHCLDVFDFAPRLLLKSPEPGCGKTTLLDVLAELSPRPLPVNNITASALFRAVELARPTVIIDEADTFLTENEELRGLVNSGHRRSIAFVVRNTEIQGQHEPRKFSTWAAMVIAGLGGQHRTIEDRSIVVELRRKLPGERTARLDGEARQRLHRLARHAARWVLDHRLEIAKANPVVSELQNRAADNWGPLLMIARAAGGPWPEFARAAALALSEARDTSSYGTMALEDIRDLFLRKSNPDDLLSKTIVEELAGLEHRPWPEISAGKPISPNKLAKLLKPFGIAPKHRQDGNVYRLSAFTEAWSRYLPPLPGDQTFSPSETHTNQQLRQNPKVQQKSGAEASRQPADPQKRSVSEGMKVRNSGWAGDRTIGRCSSCGFIAPLDDAGRCGACSHGEVPA